MICRLLSFALAATTTLAAQQPVEPSPSATAEATFYRAFWLETGEHRPSQAVDAYRAFLVQAPGHVYAARALERTRAILTKLGRAGEIDAVVEAMQQARRNAPARPGGVARLDPTTAVTDDLRRREESLAAEIEALESDPSIARLRHLEGALEEIRTELQRRADKSGEESDGSFRPYFNDFDITTMTRQDRAMFMSQVRSFVRSAAKDLRSRGELERARHVVQLTDRAASLVNVNKYEEAQRVLLDVKRELGGN